MRRLHHSRVLAVLAAAVLAAGGCTFDRDPTPEPSVRPDPSYTGAPANDPGPLALPPPGDYSWALAVLDEPVVNGPASADTVAYRVESVVKPWLAADWLRGHGGRDADTEVDEATRADLRTMISASDDKIAERYFRALDGDASTERMIRVCELAHTTVVPGFWARTTMTTADLARLGRCLADGRAAGPTWTPWLVQAMAERHDEGHWGLVDGLIGADAVPYMNGWTRYDSGWQVNCLALGASWALAVMARYKAELGLAHGQRICATVGQEMRQRGVV